jgi:thiamine-monophosphate kinase
MSPDTPLCAVGERHLLKLLRQRIPAGRGVLVGVGDDTAVLEMGPLVLATTDSMVEGVHFRRDWTPVHLLGRKALSRNLSDIGAMAGQPRHALVSLCLPEDITVGWLDGFYDGLLERAAEAGVDVVGGNLSSTPGPIVIDVTLLGEGARPLRRCGGRPGDHLVVTGALGAAATGLGLLAQGARLDDAGDLADGGPWTEASWDVVVRCLRAHLDPSPPLSFGRALGADDIAHAGIDLSDGLSSDLLALCEASGLTARLWAEALPVDPACAVLERAQGRDPLDSALHGGEDYELLLAVADPMWPALASLAGVWGLSLSRIGRLEAGEPAVHLVTPAGSVLLEPRSYEHFSVAVRPRA